MNFKTANIKGHLYLKKISMHILCKLSWFSVSVVTVFSVEEVVVLGATVTVFIGVSGDEALEVEDTKSKHYTF